MKKVLIIGGGFGGARAALDLARAGISDLKIVLVNDKPHFEYHAALYRLVTGRSPLEVCIPLRDVFENTEVEVVIDTIEKVDLEKREAAGSSGAKYSYDFAVLALGSETSYFNIPGLKELAFGFKSITEALRLKNHLHKLFEDGKEPPHFVVVGGGASGVELAGELAVYAQSLAKAHGTDPNRVTVDLIEAAPRLLPLMPESFAKVLADRLRHWGVNIFLNQSVMKEDIEQLYMKDMQLKTKTVIWTAGIKPNALYGQIAGLTLDKKGRVAVNKFLQVPNFPEVFVVGDAAATQYAGMAQTALHNGRYAADAIAAAVAGTKIEPYQPKAPAYAIPVGPRWAGVIIGGFRFYGYLGWLLRRLADLRFFVSILPWRKAWLVFQNEKTICESCLICTPDLAGHP